MELKGSRKSPLRVAVATVSQVRLWEIYQLLNSKNISLPRQPSIRRKFQISWWSWKIFGGWNGGSWAILMSNYCYLIGLELAVKEKQEGYKWKFLISIFHFLHLHHLHIGSQVLQVINQVDLYLWLRILPFLPIFIDERSKLLTFSLA